MTLFALVRLDVDCVDYTKRCIVLSCFGLACAIGAHARVATSLEAQGPCRGRNPEAAPAAQLDRRATPADTAELFEFDDHLKYVKPWSPDNYAAPFTHSSASTSTTTSGGLKRPQA
jgi:hypothetical protein